ncbi:MAG: molybdopterin converting factor subunit 1 [Methyloligellaceae bacterium]
MKLLYFAWVREKTGISSEDVELPENIQTISDLIDWLITRGPEFEAAFSKRDVIRTAINQTHVQHDSSIAEAREIAFFPPVTGG